MPKTVLYLALILLCFSRLVWLEDTSFINDEPKILTQAKADAAAGVFTIHGIKGTRGVDYGPLPVWVYRSLLTLSSDLQTVLLLRTTLVALVLLISLIVMARVLGVLNPWFIILVPLSPYLWFYGRDLWDNSLLVPLSAAAFASYVWFIKSNSRLALVICCIVLALAFNTHLMSLPLTLGVAIHLVLTRKHESPGQKVFYIGLAVLFLILIFPYIYHLVTATRDEGGLRLGWLRSIVFSLLPARIFSAQGLDYFLGDVLNPVLVAVSALAFVFYLYGLVVAWKTIWRAAVIPRPQSGRRESPDFYASLCQLALIIQLLFTLMCFFQGLDHHPHYYNGYWVVGFFFVWLGLDELWKKYYAGRWLVGLYLASSALVFVWVPWHLHQNGGNRELHHGPTFANMLAVARQIIFCTDQSYIDGQTIHAKEFPHTLMMLKSHLLSLELKAYEMQRCRGSIQYVDSGNPHDGHIEFVWNNQ